MGTCSLCGNVKLVYSGKNPNGNIVYGCSVSKNLRSRAFKYKKKYGIKRPANYENLSCAICGGNTRIAYDHCHKTGRFRGWLCMKCNTALGLVNDDVVILKKLIAYLQA